MQAAENKKNLRSLSGKETVDENLLKPFNQLVQTNRNKSGAILGLALNHWLDIPESKLNLINEIVDIFYNHRVLTSDMKDTKEARGEIYDANKLSDVSAAVIAASYSYVVALEKCVLLEHPKAIAICTKYLLLAFKGNGYECYWRDELVCPTVKDFNRLSNATTCYFLMTLELMQIFSKHKENFSTLVKLLGEYDQIRNDYISLWSEEYMRDRNCYYGDITDGKFSFPITYAVNISPKSHEILLILKQKTEDIELKKYCMSLIEECGTKEHTRKRLDDLLQQVFEQIKKFGGNPLLEKFIDDMMVTDNS